MDWTFHQSLKSLFAIAAITTFAVAQQNAAGANGSYPNKPVRLIVGNAPGGASDITARAIAQKLSEQWKGSSVVVDNRAGAAGLIALDLTAKANSDGHTLLIASGGTVASAMVLKRVGYDVRKAYAPVTELTSQYLLMLSKPSLPLNSVKEMIAYAKTKPGALNFGTSGLGSLGHAGLELIKFGAGVDIVHVPYKGAGPALADLLGGQIDLVLASTIAGVPYVKTGRMKALAVTGLTRLQTYPTIPTVAESGVPEFELANWYGLYAPAGTPSEIILLLHRDATTVLNNPDVQSKFDGAEATPSASPSKLKERLANEIIKFEKLVKIPSFANSVQ